MEQREERSKSVCFEAPGHLVDCGPAGAGWNLGLPAFPSLLGCRSRLFCSLEPCKDCTVFSQLWQGYKAWPLPTLYFCKIPVFLASRARLACIRCSLLFFFFGHARGIRKLPDQGANSGHSCDNARSATR